MGRLRDVLRSLTPGNDAQLAADLAAQRRANHRARVHRDGDKAGAKMPRRYRQHNG
ncbi:hypothetical protein AB0D49_08315 [Streptomyces sp. NPDC048290]|uniref:hypothetical protein n=1 Tax=Streptomyces sp. NPDC048290 TaxID=3155811 RepID=UPI00341AB827